MKRKRSPDFCAKVVGISGGRVEARTVALYPEGEASLPGAASFMVYDTGTVLVIQSYGPKLRGHLDASGLRSLGESLIAYADRLETRE